MIYFLDTADAAAIARLCDLYPIAGVTTNPTLILKSGRNIFDVLKEICALVKGPISAEVAATDAATMIKEGEKLADIAPNICIKVPLTWDGLKACRHFANKGVKVNVTLCFSPAQAILAAKSGAAFISPFVGRVDDVGMDGLTLISDITRIYANYPEFKTEVLVASVRNPVHIVESAKMGAHVATLPYSVMKQLVQHPLTDKGLAQFVKDWESTGQKIA